MTFRTDRRDTDVSYGSVDSKCSDVAILAVTRATHHCRLLTDVSEKETRKNACVLSFNFMLFYFCCCCPDRVSLCNSPGCPEAHFVDQAGLELTEIPLCLSPKGWD